jgi:hypothetical protein
MSTLPADDLLEHIELRQCECLNASGEHTLRHCLEQGLRDQPTLFLQSDCDEEVRARPRARPVRPARSRRDAVPARLTAPAAVPRRAYAHVCSAAADHDQLPLAGPDLRHPL